MAAMSEKPDKEQQVPFPPNALEIFCRLRAQPSTENAAESNPLIHRQSDTVLSLRRANSPNTEQQFTFEHIFDVDCSQRQLFHRVAAPKIAALLSGEGDGLIFAYGTTGSGKSFTIGGQPGKPGLVPNAIASLFSQLAGRLSTANIVDDGLNYYTIESGGGGSLSNDADEDDSGGKGIIEKWLALATNFVVDEAKVVNRIQRRRYAVFISFVEIYNNYIYDLLKGGGKPPGGPGQQTMTPVDVGVDGRRRPALQLRLDVGRSTVATHKSTNFSVYAHGARQVQAKTAKQAMRLFLQGLANRQTAATQLNLTSSRSHSVFTIKLVSYEEPQNAVIQPQLFTVNQLSVVDLAGVERSKWSKVSGAALAETSNINNSLLTLRNCFQVMRLNQQQQQQQASSSTRSAATAAVVPYRNHKLTYLLKSFFEGGQSNISMIICLNALADAEENAQVLAFCSKAQEVLIVKQQKEQENFEVDEEVLVDANDDHLTSIVNSFTLTRPHEGKAEPLETMTTSADFAAFISQTEQYLSAHASEATLLIDTWNQSMQQLSDFLKRYPPERQDLRQSFCLNERTFYSLKTSARIVSLLKPPPKGRKGCGRASCKLYRARQLRSELSSITANETPIILSRGPPSTAAVPGGGSVANANGKLKNSQLLYQSNAHLLRELTRELTSWQAASVDAAMKQQGARAELAVYINRGNKGGGGGSVGAGVGGSVKKKLDVFNRLYLQTPARYKTAAAGVARTRATANNNRGKVSKLCAFFTPPSSAQQPKNATTTTVAASDTGGNSTPRKAHPSMAASKTVVQSMCKRFNDM